MKHSGKARKAAWKMLIVTLILVALVPIIGFLATVAGAAMIGIAIFLFVVWLAFALFVLYFFRDPNPTIPAGSNLVLSPGHGKVDVIDTTSESKFMGGECKRVSIFLSVVDVHVQNAPVTGKVAYLKHTEGEFMNAMKTECATCNENVLIGFETAEPAGVKIGLRLIAGVIARRIVPWVESGDEVMRGDRISLIQFGSRCDVYLPLSARINVKLGDRVVGGESIIANLE
ncbi:MAG TPA: phosphatidylserine decarboxylase [Verrucomicrobiae bacterium]|nr:phosphatidylserine decarboxylase [Verrucomicrobiae bacterium]